MNIYTIKGDGHYGGGMAVVAAESPENARELAGTIRDKGWGTNYREGDVVEIVHNVSIEAAVLDHYETGE